MDHIGAREDVAGSFVEAVQQDLLESPESVLATSAALVSHVPQHMLVDVLAAAGLDPELVSARRRRGGQPGGGAQGGAPQSSRPGTGTARFCGCYGHPGGWPVGLDAGHVRWFSSDVPDELDNGLALCSLHHTFFDRGALGLGDDLTVHVSKGCTAPTEAGRGICALHGRALAPGRVRRCLVQAVSCGTGARCSRAPLPA